MFHYVLHTWFQTSISQELGEVELLLLKFGIIGFLACSALQAILLHVHPQTLPIKPFCDLLVGLISTKITTYKEYEVMNTPPH